MKYLLLLPCLLFFTISLALTGYSVDPKKNKHPSSSLITPARFTALTGIRLNLSQKLAFYAMQKKLRRHKGKKIKSRDPSKTALILGIIGLSIVWIPLLTLASIPLSIFAIVLGTREKRRDPSNRKARTAVVLGIITLSLVVVAALVVAYLFSNAKFF